MRVCRTDPVRSRGPAAGVWNLEVRLCDAGWMNVSQPGMRPGTNSVAPKPRGRARRLQRLRPRVSPRAHFVKSAEAIATFSPKSLVEVDRYDRTVLHVLAREGRVDLCKSVLRRIPVSMRTRFLNMPTSPVAPGCGGRTALHIAALYGHVPLYWKLVRSGADPTLRDRKGRTPAGIMALMLRAAERNFSETVGQMATRARST